MDHHSGNSSCELSRRRALLLGGSAALIGFTDFFLPNSADAASAGADISYGNRSRHEVALTFHGGGDLTIAHKILAIAKKTHTPITVLAVGTWLNANPTIGHEIVNAGHELGNHTYSHKTMTLLSLKEASAEIAKGKAAVVKAVGNAGKYFRPSGTIKSNAMIRKAAGASGYAHCLSYDVDAMDYQAPSANAIVATCMKAVHDKKLTPVAVTQLLRP